MMTRDSSLWWWFIGASVLTALTTHFDLLHAAIPILPTWVDPLLELCAMLAGTVSGIMRMSPLPISPEGRVDAAKKNAVQADAASVAVVDAAKAMATAAIVTDVAADKAKVAKDAVDKVN